MGLFGNFFSLGSTSIALIDIGSGSVGGGYLSLGKNGPTLEYAVRVPITIHPDESVESSMLRALVAVNKELTIAGASALRRATGSGSVGEVFVSIAAPWQDTKVRLERIEEAKPFTFTRAMLQTVVQKTAQLPTGRISSGESAIAVRLNGYQTSQPFGKQAKLAEIVILSSTVEESITDKVRKALRASYHSHHITFTAFAPLAYIVLRDMYPHEREFMVIDVTGEATEMVFIRHGFLSSVLSVPYGVHHLLKTLGNAVPPTSDMQEVKDGVHLIKNQTANISEARDTWLTEILEALKAYSERHALPRTIFLLSDDPVRDYIRHALDDSRLRTLWLSDEPLSILPVLASQFLPHIKIGASGSADLFLMMLALYQGKRIDDLGA